MAVPRTLSNGYSDLLPQIPASVERRLMAASPSDDSRGLSPRGRSPVEGLVQRLAHLERDEMARIHEAVADVVRAELSPVQGLVQRLVAQTQELADVRRALDERKETKKVTVSENQGLPEGLQGDIRRIMREELSRDMINQCSPGTVAAPPVAQEKRWQETPLPRVAMGDSDPAHTPAPAPAPASVESREAGIGRDSDERANEARNAADIELSKNSSEGIFGGMQTIELAAMVDDAFDDPMGDAGDEFQQDFKEAIDNPKVMEVAICKLIGKGFCGQAIRPFVHWIFNVEEPERSGYCNGFVHNRRFEFACNMVILMNALYAAYSADWEMKNLNDEPPPFMEILELVFMSFYVIELLLKIFIHRFFFFINDEAAWNNFDFLLVTLSVYEQVMAQVQGGGGASVTFMRIFRLLKLSKILRLFRALKFLQELRLMMAAIARTMGALFWAMVMVTFFFFVFGLVMLQGLTGYLAEGRLDGSINPLIEDDIRDKFGSMATTMTTLYKVTTGGDDWGNAYETVVHAGGLYSAFFLFFIAFFAFAVMNILTGMIVENVAGLASQDVEAACLSYRREKQMVAEEARSLFQRLDMDHSGQLAFAEWEIALQSDQMHALMSAMNLHIQDGRMFFDILRAASGSDAISVNNFINGVMRMKGDATAIDMQCALIEVRAIHKMVAEIAGKEHVDHPDMPHHL